MITLISHSEANQAISFKLHLRRLSHYSLVELEELYLIMKYRVLSLYYEINKLYDVKKLNFAYDFNLDSRYIENCQFKGQEPKKEEVIERIIMFYRTEFLIEHYLKQLKEVQPKI
jgi:hypothetical protein